MYAAERYRSIVERVVGKGRASVTDLADDLAVTPETIRRDLSYLESRGLVRRVHGGAVPVGRVIVEAPVAARNEERIDLKRRIAQAAVAELPQQGAVIVDAGTTTGQVLDLIPDDYELTIITDSVDHALRLANRPNITTMILGGRVRGRTLACVDQWAINALAGIYADVAIVGTNGIDPVRGLTTPDMAEAGVKRAMLRAARRKVVLADHTKFGADHFAQFATAAEMDVLITDRDTAPDDLAGFANSPMSVVVV